MCVFVCVSGMYELASYQMRPGGPAVWGDAFRAAVTTHDAPGYGKLVGAFHSEVGPLNTGTHTFILFLTCIDSDHN